MLFCVVNGEAYQSRKGRFPASARSNEQKRWQLRRIASLPVQKAMQQYRQHERNDQRDENGA
jgi:hypothetical protein